MDYETSPVSIKKRNPTRNKLNKSSKKMDKETIDPKNLKTAHDNPQEKTSETPARTSRQVSDSPQFMDFAESPEFRVGWDDGFGPPKSCDQIKINEAVTASKKKTNKKIFVRTLRTQRILSTINCQSEPVKCEDHPDSDEFLQWAESLLYAPSVPDVPESPKNLNSSKLNPFLNTSNVQQSPKSNDLRTPKRSVANSTPSSGGTRQATTFKSNRRPSLSSKETDITNSSYKKLQQSPLVTHSNRTLTGKLFSSEKCVDKSMKSPAEFKTNNHAEFHRDDYNDFFNDSVNDLMIKCSQAVESRLNKENSMTNLLDDSANEMILQCTQQVEEELFQQSKHSGANVEMKRSSDSTIKRVGNDESTNVDLNRNFNNTSTKRFFVPKQSNYLHKLDSPNTILFDDSPKTNVISSINKELAGKGFDVRNSTSPNSLRVSSKSLSADSNEKNSNKHFLSPTTRDDATSRKKFCHNNNIVTSSKHRDAVTSSSIEDLNSILNEDEDMLCNLDIDEVLSQVPYAQPSTKSQFIVPDSKNSTPKLSEHRDISGNTLGNSKQNTFSFNGLKPNPVNSLPVQPTQDHRTKPLSIVPDVTPKYTEEQIQLKKIEAKRRQALKLRAKQRSFELK